MSDHQEITIKTYDNYALEYVEHALKYPASPEVEAWLDLFVDLVADRGVILEVGSGPGFNAAYLEGKGARIYRTDVSKSFCDYQQNLGYRADIYDVLAGPYTAKAYYAILANAVFLHFDADQLRVALANLCVNLPPRGLLAASLKSGDDEGFETQKLPSPRYFKYWTDERLRPIWEAAGFEVVYFSDKEDSRPGRRQTWLFYILKRS